MSAAEDQALKLLEASAFETLAAEVTVDHADLVIGAVDQTRGMLNRLLNDMRLEVKKRAVQSVEVAGSKRILRCELYMTTPDRIRAAIRQAYNAGIETGRLQEQDQ